MPTLRLDKKKQQAEKKSFEKNDIAKHSQQTVEKESMHTIDFKKSEIEVYHIFRDIYNFAVRSWSLPSF